jgi:transcriptional regulator with XRE-family HTH domain
MARPFDELVQRTMSKQRQAKVAARAKELVTEYLLGEIRELMGKSQSEIAKKLGIKQPSLSKLEKQTDIQISTLQRIVEALGGTLEVTAQFPNGAIKIDQFGKPPRKPRARKPAVKSA